MKSNVIIKGEVFIIPNEIITVNSFIGDERKQREQFEHVVSGIHRDIISLIDEAYVQVWCVTPGDKDSNWSCHREMPGKENFPGYLPISLFLDKKEGDVVEFDTRWGHVELKLNQKSYRYRYYMGNNHENSFEEVLEYKLSQI